MANIINITNDNTPVLSPIAEALIYYATHDFKKAKRVTRDDLGSVELFHQWRDIINDLLNPAYKVWAFNHDNILNPNATPDKTVLYSKLRTLCDFIGEVNGFKLLPEKLESDILAMSRKSKDITKSIEMAHAESERDIAIANKKKATTQEAFEAALALEEQWKAEIKRLGNLPGHKKAIFTQQVPGTFSIEVELFLRDAVSEQHARPIEDIIREREERDAARKAARKEKKRAKAKAEEAAKAEATDK